MKQSGAMMAGLVLLVLSLAACEDRQPEPSASAPLAGVTPSAAPAVKAPLLPGPGASAGADPACAVVCQRAAELGCRAANACPRMCAEMLSEPNCAKQLRAAITCFGKHPSKNWECDEDGMAAIKDGFCDQEQAETARCLGLPSP